MKAREKDLKSFELLGLVIGIIGMFLDTRYDSNIGIILIIIGFLTAFRARIVSKKKKH